nr:hypothetical protein [Tanacetum cinerariifolium]
MTESNKKQCIADVKVMNYLLQAITNDIYNSVHAYKNAKEMWERIRRLVFGSDVTNHVRHSRLMDEFQKFVAKEGESLEYVYERLTIFVNIMDRNNVRPIPVSINTKFLNCLQPEWRKYVTMYVTHPSSVVDYEEDYKGKLQGDSQEDKLTTAMIEQMLLAMKDEAESNLNDEENDFMLDNSFKDETLEELTAVVRIVLKLAKTTKNRTISTQNQKPQRKAGPGSKFSANNLTMKPYLSKFQSLGTILA